MPEISIFDARLAEIDRRLRTIQSGLQQPGGSDPGPGGPGLDSGSEPESESDLEPVAATDSPPVATADPEPAADLEPTDDPEPAPAPERPAASRLPPPTPLRVAPPLIPPGESDEFVGPSAPLLTQLHDLREAHERLLELHRELLSQYAEVLERRAADAATAAVTAGPFSDAEALRSFEDALATLPGVDEVAVREYLGADRVVLDVRLSSR